MSGLLSLIALAILRYKTGASMMIFLSCSYLSLMTMVLRPVVNSSHRSFAF